MKYINPWISISFLVTAGIIHHFYQNNVTQEKQQAESLDSPIENLNEMIINDFSAPLIENLDTIPFEDDLRDMIWSNKTLVLFDKFWPDEFLEGLLKDGQWLEQYLRGEFVDWTVQRNFGNWSEGDYDNYHRVSSTYWLTHLKPHYAPFIPHIQKYLEFMENLKDAINRQLPEEWEIGEVEQQYLLYEKGGRFEMHHDTLADPFNCTVSEHFYPRLLTFIVYLNPDWQKEDGGQFMYAEDQRRVMKTLKYVPPTMGKAAIFRADRLFHGSDVSQKPKRALTLFYNIKKKGAPLAYN